MRGEALGLRQRFGLAVSCGLTGFLVGLDGGHDD
jgi:hypothetical protein